MATDQLRLQFGLQPPEGTTAAWGARYIYQRARRYPGKLELDFVGDRQSSFGDKEKVKAIIDWVNAYGERTLRQAVDNGYMAQPDEDWQWSYSSKGYVILANPRRSFGYLYVCAYRKDDADAA